MVSVVLDDPQSQMRRLLAEPHPGDVREPLRVQPSIVDAERMAVVERLVCAAHELILASGDHAVGQVQLAHDLQWAQDL